MCFQAGLQWMHTHETIKNFLFFCCRYVFLPIFHCLNMDENAILFGENTLGLVKNLWAM